MTMTHEELMKKFQEAIGDSPRAASNQLLSRRSQLYDMYTTNPDVVDRVIADLRSRMMSDWKSEGIQFNDDFDKIKDTMIEMILMYGFHAGNASPDRDWNNMLPFAILCDYQPDPKETHLLGRRYPSPDMVIYYYADDPHTRHAANNSEFSNPWPHAAFVGMGAAEIFATCDAAGITDRNPFVWIFGEQTMLDIRDAMIQYRALQTL